MWSLWSLPVEIDLIPVLFPPRLLPFSPSWLAWAEELGTIVMVYLTTGPKTRQPSDHELKPQVKTSFSPLQCSISAGKPANTENDLAFVTLKYEISPRGSCVEIVGPLAGGIVLGESGTLRRSCLPEGDGSPVLTSRPNVLCALFSRAMRQAATSSCLYRSSYSGPILKA